MTPVYFIIPNKCQSQSQLLYYNYMSFLLQVFIFPGINNWLYSTRHSYLCIYSHYSSKKFLSDRSYNSRSFLHSKWHIIIDHITITYFSPTATFVGQSLWDLSFLYSGLPFITLCVMTLSSWILCLLSLCHFLFYKRTLCNNFLSMDTRVKIIWI